MSSCSATLREICLGCGRRPRCVLCGEKSRASALSQLKVGIGRRTIIWQAAGNKEVSHEEDIHCPINRPRTSHAARSYQEAQRHQPEGATCPDSPQNRCRRPRLDRQPHRRSLLLSAPDGGEDPSTFCRIRFSRDPRWKEACQATYRETARWGTGSQGDRHPPWVAAERLCQLDAPVACSQGGRIGDCRLGQL